MPTTDPPGASTTRNVYLILNQQITPLVRDVTRMGRQFDNDLVLQDTSVSRMHAEIRFEEGQYILYDLQSTSGTFVNSRKVTRCVLNSGDLISLAGVQLMFVNNNPRLANRSSVVTSNLKPKDH